MEGIKKLDIAIDLSSPNVDKQVKRVCASMITGWDINKLSVLKLSGGYINDVYKVSKANAEKEAIVVRVLTIRTSVLVYHDWVLPSMLAVWKAGLGADVIGTFNNGLVYTFIPGEPISPDKYDDYQIRRKAAELIARLNSIEDETIKGAVPRAQSDIREHLNGIPDDCQSIFGRDHELISSSESMHSEVAWLLGEVKKLNCPTAFCNGDPWWVNILYDAESGGCHIIDFDFAGYNYWPYDMARFLSGCNFRMQPPKGGSLSQAEEKELCRDYIRESRKYRGMSDTVTDSEVETMFGLTLTMKLVSLLINVVGTCKFIPKIGVEEELLQLISEFEKEYLRTKAQYMAYIEKHSINTSSWTPWALSYAQIDFTAQQK